MKKPSAETQVSTGANEKRFINQTYICRFLKQRSFASSRGTHSKTGKNTMKPLIRILSLWLAALCFGACTDDDLIDGTPTPEPETGIVIRLSAGNLEQTRTDLTSQANLHNVQSVYAILYKENADKSDYEYVTCDDLEWSPKDSSSYGEAQAQSKVLDLPNDIALGAGNYTVLCVGLDDKSSETYDLPEAIKSKTLSEAKATLAQSKGKEDIAKSELFAGWKAFHFVPDSLNVVDVTMKRRVAGVLCYLTDVPYQLTKEDGTWRVQKVILRLFTQQNKSISLLRPEQTVVANKYVDDFGDASFEEDSNSNILMEFDLSSYGPQDNNKELYEIPVTGENQLPNTLLGGVYMIPINNETTDQNTLQIELWGKKIENDELTGDEACIRSFPAINDDIDLEESGAPSSSYPIRPNIIYHIGTKPSNDGTTGDTPESLAGTKVNIVAEEWTDQEINVEFPSVSVELRMELMDMDVDKHIYTNLQPQNQGDAYFIFDCIGSKDFYHLNVYPSVLYDKWKVQAYVGNIDDNEEDRGIYFKQTSNQDPNEALKYKDVYEGSGYISIPIVITDYAKNDRKDTRKITISLVALDGEEPVEETRKTMVIEQYNAIPVTMENGDVRGFSRFDLYAKRNKDTGIFESASGLAWTEGDENYHNRDEYYIYGSSGDSDDNGLANYTNADRQTLSNNDKKKAFDNSALSKAASPFITGNNDEAVISEVDFWYLPAKDELSTFLTQIGASPGSYNITPYNQLQDRYCTSTVYGTRKVYVYYIENNKAKEWYMEDVTSNAPWRTSWYRVRQCCHMD